MHARSVQSKAKKRSSMMASVTSDESVELQELSLELHTNFLEMKRLLSLSSSESSTRSEEGRGDQKMSPELLNKAFSMKSTQCIYCIYDKKPNGTLFSTYKTGM